MLLDWKDIKTNHVEAKLLIFDLDGTLTPSKMPMDREMSELLHRLLEVKKVAVIGGGKYQKFQEQLLNQLKVREDLLKNLFLFPATASAFYRYANGSPSTKLRAGWQLVYTEELTEYEKKKIFEAFEEAFRDLNYSHPEKVFGELIEDRGSEVTFSALGQEAPLELKKQWKRKHEADKLEIARKVQEYLPEFEVRAAGYTSVDVTRKGIDKEYGVRQISKYLDVPIENMIFVGDALFEGGNDEAALKTGITAFSVSGPEETKRVIQSLL